MTRTRLAPLTALLLAALFLAGCGGGGGEPSVTQTVHDELQAELDAALAGLEKERKAKAEEAAARTTAETEVTRLEGVIGDMDDPAPDSLRGELAAARGRVAALTTQIGDMDDPAAESLRGMLAAANADVRRLNGELNTANGEVTQLTTDLDTANNKAAELTDRIGSADDADSLQGMLAEANADVRRLSGELDTANGKVTGLEDDLGTARNKVTELEGQIGTATDPDSLQGMLNAATLKVGELESNLRTAKNEIDSLRRRLDDAQTDVTDAERRADLAEREADKKIEEAEQQTNVSLRAVPVITGLGKGARRGNDDTVVVQWMRDKSLEVEPGGGDFTQGTAAPSISGFSRRFSFTRRSGTASARIDETAYIYTNIQSPGNRAFWKVYGFSPIVLGGDNAPALAKGGTARAKTEIQANGTTNVTEITVTGGRFNSAVGTFTCTTCEATDLGGGDRATTAEINAYIAMHVTYPERLLTFASPVSSWTFSPTSPTAGVPLTQDNEFLYFGIWYSTPDLATNLAADSHGFEVIHGGSEPYTALASLSGPYKFSGGAIGKYAIADLPGQKAKIGTFTADATLTAVMGDSPTLAGRITNFRENGTALNGWSVTLGTSTGEPNDTFATGDLTSSDGATAEIGGVPASGAWAATLYGSVNVRTGATEEQTEAKYPLADLAGVAGRFEASNTQNTAAIAGAFAATPIK